MSELHAKHRQRMREKLIMHGGAAFNDHELLEMMLYNVIPRQNTNPLAHTLLNAFGSLEKVFLAPMSALLNIEGVGKQTATYIILAGELYRRIRSESDDNSLKVLDSERAMEIIMPEFNAVNEEKIFILALDNESKICYKGFLSEGCIGSVQYRAREIMDICVPVKASMYYLAHNHPSGIATPSWTDVKSSVLTENILTPMKMLMMDHFVIADGDYVSMKDSNMLMRQMRMSQITEILGEA